MKQIKPYKLKRKIWIISAIILSVYIIALISNPTVWTALLPVIIPSAILTVGIPGYAITKHMKYMLEKETLKLSNSEKDIKSTQQKKRNIKAKTNNYISKNEDLIDNIANDKNLTYETKKQMLETLKTGYEQDQQTEKYNKKFKILNNKRNY